MNRWFEIGLVLSILAIAAALFQQATNGRYRYSVNGNQGIIVDTRTGEFWVEDGTHIEPRIAHITVHHPRVDDETTTDGRTQEFSDCLKANIQAIRTHAAKRDCAAEQHFSSAPSTPSQ